MVLQAKGKNHSRVRAFFKVLVTTGACVAAATAVSLYKKSQSMETVFTDVDATKLDLDEKGTVLNCDIGISCNDKSRKCPGFKGSEGGEYCGYGFVGEEKFTEGNGGQ